MLHASRKLSPEKLQTGVVAIDIPNCPRMVSDFLIGFGNALFERALAFLASSGDALDELRHHGGAAIESAAA